MLNTHTEITATGEITTENYNVALDRIRDHLHAGKDYIILPVGAGSTAAIEKIQKILGVYLAPKLNEILVEQGIDISEKLKSQTVVFVSGYEHHSNDSTWQVI